MRLGTRKLRTGSSCPAGGTERRRWGQARKFNESNEKNQVKEDEFKEARKDEDPKKRRKLVEFKEARED